MESVAMSDEVRTAGPGLQGAGGFLAGAALGAPAAKPPRRLRSIFCLDDFEAAARRYLPKPLFGYVAGATENNVTLADNRAVFDEIRLVPRVLVDVSSRTQETMLFGRRYAAPFGIAPMGITALMGYRGDLVLARAAARANIVNVMSGSSLIRLEEVAATAPESWFQIYVPNESQRVAALVDRIAAAGFKTLVVTVDSSVVPNRENNVRAGFKTPLEPNLSLMWQGMTHPFWVFEVFLRTLLRHGMPYFENNQAERGAPIVSRTVARDFSGRERFDWAELDRIRARWHGPLVLKGILNPEDARRAREHGADGIIVSNHGGRQLDGVPSPLRVLPAVKAAAGDMSVMIDSGFRRGTDILKALALGADYVFIGRPFNYAAAVGGEAGVDHAIALMMAELKSDMGLIGINSLAEMGPEHLFGEGWWR
jgi:L-lactate dehydrogenase (cytochrome)